MARKIQDDERPARPTPTFASLAASAPAPSFSEVDRRKQQEEVKLPLSSGPSLFQSTCLTSPFLSSGAPIGPPTPLCHWGPRGVVWVGMWVCPVFLLVQASGNSLLRVSGPLPTSSLSHQPPSWYAPMATPGLGRKGSLQYRVTHTASHRPHHMPACSPGTQHSLDADANVHPKQSFGLPHWGVCGVDPEGPAPYPQPNNTPTHQKH